MELEPSENEDSDDSCHYDPQRSWLTDETEQETEHQEISPSPVFQDNRELIGKREPKILFKDQQRLLQAVIQSLQAQKTTTQDHNWKKDENCYLTGDHSGIYQISHKIALRLCGKDCYGFSKNKNNTSGTHRVISQDKVHFKLSPAQDEGGAIGDIRPGMEYMVSSFYRLFMGTLKGVSPVTPSTLLVLNNIRFQDLKPNLNDHEPNRDILNNLYDWAKICTMSDNTLTLQKFLNRNPDVRSTLEKHGQWKSRCAFIQASLSVPGQDFDQFLKDGGDITQLDRAHYSALVISSLITGSSDGKADNYRIGPAFTLHCIDNDEAFVPSMENLKNDEHIPQLKCILFFLPLMKERIDPKIVDHLINQSPEILLYSWIHTLEDQNRRYLSLVEENHLSERTLHNLNSSIRLPSGLTIILYDRLKRTQEALEKNKNLTHNDLFMLLEPLVYQYYQNLLSQDCESLCEKADTEIAGTYRDLFSKNLPDPMLRMMLLYGQGDLIPLTFEKVCCGRSYSTRELVKTCSYNSESGNDFMLSPADSLREWIQHRSVAAPILIDHVENQKDYETLRLFLSWKVGTFIQFAKSLSLPDVALPCLTLKNKTFDDKEANTLANNLMHNTSLTSFSLLNDHRKKSCATNPSAITILLNGLSQHTTLTSLAIEGYDLGVETCFETQSLSIINLSFTYGGIHDNGAMILPDRFPHLTSLNLTGNMVGTNGVYALLSKLHLNYLNLQRNESLFHNKSPLKSVFQALRNHTHLKSLDLSKTGIDNDILAGLASAFRTHPSLTDLNLSGNMIHIIKEEDLKKLKGLEIKTLISKGSDGLKLLASNSSLKTLNLSNNRLGDRGVKSLVTAFRREGLTTLNLSKNGIEENGMKLIGSFLQSTNSLKELNIAQNGFGDQGLEYLIKALPFNATLTSLNLSSTNISAKNTLVLFKVLENNLTLTTLQIIDNYDISEEFLMHVLLTKKRRKSSVPSLNIITQLLTEKVVV